MIFSNIVKSIEGRITKMVVTIVAIVQVRVDYNTVNPDCINPIARCRNKNKRKASITAHKRIVIRNDSTVLPRSNRHCKLFQAERDVQFM